MEHPTIEEAIESCLPNRKDKWDQFFNGDWFLCRTEEGFSEYAFVYEGKIWYGEEKHGSGSYYSEGTIKNVLPLFLNSHTQFMESKLSVKMNEIIDKKNQGFLIHNGMGTFDFQTRTKAIYISDFNEGNSVMDMFDLGEHLAFLIMDPDEWNYVEA